MRKRTKSLLMLSLLTVVTFSTIFTGCGSKKADTNSEPKQDEEEYVEPADSRILEDTTGSNETFTWTKSVVSYEEDDKLQYINATINDKSLPDFASVSILVNYNDMKANAVVTYYVSGEEDKTVEVKYDCDENGIKTSTSEDIRNKEAYEQVISDMVYAAFH